MEALLTLWRSDCLIGFFVVSSHLLHDLLRAGLTFLNTHDWTAALAIHSEVAVSGNSTSPLGAAAGGWLHRSSKFYGIKSSTSRAQVLDAEAADLWIKVHEASRLHLGAAVELPESRTVNMDWVRDGMHIRR